MRVLVSGDEFVTPQVLADAVEAELGAGLDVVRHATAWPTEPFGPVGRLRECSGDEQTFADLIGGVELWLAHLSPVSERVLEAADALRFVGVPRGGPVNVDLDAARRRGIVVCNLPGRNARAVAEYTLGVMICGPRGIIDSATRMRSGTWTGELYAYRRTGPELSGATVGLIGLGQIGRRVARLLCGVGARVRGFDPYVDEDVFTAAGAERVEELGDLLGGCDIVSLHARLTGQARGPLLGGAQFAAISPGTYFVNTARGDLVDQAALVQALRSGQLSGAALDVFDPEPPKADHPLLSLPNVVAVSHLAGASRQVAHRAARRIAAEAGRFVRGEPLQHRLV